MATPFGFTHGLTHPAPSFGHSLSKSHPTSLPNMPDDGDEADATPTPPPATPSTTPTATKWTDGNFTIISSDNHVFRIADYHLLSAR